MVEAPPGLIVLFGSGEIAASAQPVYEHVFRRQKVPIHVSVLETPAGFELNSARVAGRVADFLVEHLANYKPDVAVIPARKRGTPFSPDEPAIVAPLLSADVIMLGAGSPTYAVRQLENSLAWQILVARHRLGTPIIMASAATVAAGAYALPVYEIYKVGDELHWNVGLDLLGAFGLSLTWVPHWDNREGGAELDTSRCFMGQSRFAELRTMLPKGMTVVGIDEHTALVLDLAAETCQVIGAGEVTILSERGERRFARTESFSVAELGSVRWPAWGGGLPPAVWGQVIAARNAPSTALGPPEEVLALVQARVTARAGGDWAAADALRAQVLRLGWQINDTPQGPQLGRAT